MLKKFSLIFLLIISITFSWKKAQTQGISLIFDSEIEEIIVSLATPLLKYSGISTNSVKIYIVKNTT